MSSSCDKVPITTANQLLASGSRTLAITSTTQSESNTHTLRAMLHSSSACLQESSAPQSVHRLLCAICRWWRTSAEGRDCLARFQRNNLTFDRTCTCHSSVHSFSSRHESEWLSDSYSHVVLLSRVSTSIRYADHTENTPHLS
jgi:hypothetical protein